MNNSRPLLKVLATSATDATFPSKIPTVTEPTGAGVLDLASQGGVVPSRIVVLPFGAGADNTTFDMRIIGWRKLGALPTPGELWIPTVLAQVSCTLSAAIGIAGAPLVATDRFADTIILHATITAQGKTTDTDSAGAASTGRIVFTSPANDLVAHFTVELEGCQKVEFTFDMTGATNGNALVSFLDDDD